MILPAAEPASPVVAPREDPSTVEAPPAVPLAATRLMPATPPLPPANLPQLRPNLQALLLDPHQRPPAPLCPPPRVPILARLVRRLLRQQVGAPRPRTSSSSTTTPRPPHRSPNRLAASVPPPSQAGGTRRPNCRPQG
ncbi:hypothetical protein PF002_g7765 [Phytophthora fragariae]|uniref:Uncharacterized protein n=1 Tax=Phytophthora fragariae TaxID=53985 RepID=A0A6A3ZUI5_9STRA|nr:hypothetical protein PF003_g6139 [Phytophthora fragariae]KAE9130035.1 hypothetical protein PF007_g4647 [Phytophthora fragariae]KAE9244432.1 hypothetical protein PF002_g7765 [Phytophthora fragariae]